MTNAELAILSLVAERPRHGYEIEQVIEHRGMRDWTELGFSSIYYLLKKLERDGLIESRLEPAGRGPARRVYQAIPAGYQALETAVLDVLSTPQRAYPPLQLGLANLPVVDTEQALAALKHYCAALAERLAHVRERRVAQQPLPYFVDAMFDHSVSLIEAELAWAGRLIARLEQEPAAKQPLPTAADGHSSTHEAP